MVLEVVTYNPQWPVLFEEEAANIKLALGKQCISIHHIGSTSIPGLIAKPKIDIMIIVKSLESFDPNSLSQLGYENQGLLATPSSYYFNRFGYHLHVFEQGDEHIQLYFSFLNYLKQHKEAQQEYANLKANLADKYKDSALSTLATYTIEKSDFIKQCIAKTGFSGITVHYVRSTQEWEKYHYIRKTEIFATLGVKYDQNHPTITDSNHFHFVIKKGVDIIGVAQVEFLDNTHSALRPFAIIKEYRNKGIGSIFLARLEKWIKRQGRQIIHLHARPEAVNFYKKNGYNEMPFTENTPPINVHSIDLEKIL